MRSEKTARAMLKPSDSPAFGRDTMGGDERIASNIPVALGRVMAVLGSECVTCVTLHQGRSWMRTIGFGLKWSCYVWLVLRFSIDKPKVSQ